jgi:iron complex outermembrane receptor protein
MVLTVPPTVAGASKDIADMDLESLLHNVVVSASKHEETLEEAPANVFIVTQDMINDYACRSIAEALSLVPGIYITQDYSFSQIGVRGMSQFGDWNSRMMILVDGRPTTEQYGGTHSIDLAGVDINNIDRIEVIKGPSSSLYGSNAFFGMINLITRKPEHNMLEVTSAYFADTESKSTSGRLFHRLTDDLTVFLTGTWVDRNGSDLFFDEFSDLSDDNLLSLDDDGYYQVYLDSASFSGGVAQHQNTRETYQAHGRVDWRDFYLTFQYGQMDNGIAHGFYGALFNRPENQYYERRHFADLGYHGDVSEKVNLEARMSWDYYRWWDEVMYNYSSWEDEPAYLPGPIWKDVEFNESYGADARIIVDISDRNTAVFGAEVKLHEIEHASGETDASGDNILVDYIPADKAEHEGQIYNLYAQDEMRLSPKVKFVGGLHFNYFSYTTGRVMPKLAVIFHPHKQGSLKLIASRGFRSPTFYEITFDDGDFFIGNPDLAPELITSYELISTHEFPYGFSLEMAGNHSRMTDLILQTVIDESDPAHPGGRYLEEISQFRNLGRMNSNSIEISVQRSPVYCLSGLANLTYQTTEVTGASDTDALFNSPQWLGNFGLAYRFMDGYIQTSARVNYIGSRRLWDGTHLDGCATVDANINFNGILNLFDGVIGIKNLLDEDYEVPLHYDYAPSTSIKRPGRSAYVKLTSTLGW